MRRSLQSVLALFILAVASAAAHADTLGAGVYTLNNAFVGGSSVTGTVTFNAAGVATAANLTYNSTAYNNPGPPKFTLISSGNSYNGLTQDYITGAAYQTGQIALYANLLSDMNGHFNLCLGTAQCGTSPGTVDPATLQVYGFYNASSMTTNAGVGPVNFTSGYFTSGATVAATPEPSSLMLLGTGLLGVAGAARRKFRSV